MCVCVCVCVCVRVCVCVCACVCVYVCVLFVYVCAERMPRVDARDTAWANIDKQRGHNLRELFQLGAPPILGVDARIVDEHLRAEGRGVGKRHARPRGQQQSGGSSTSAAGRPPGWQGHGL